MSKIRMMAIAGVLLGMLVFTACNGDDDDGDSGDETPAATSATGAETPGAEPTEDDGEGNGGGGDNEELQDVADKFSEATFEVAYAVTGGGADAPFGDGSTITITKDGTDRLRFDIQGVQDGEPFDGSFITNGADSYICFTGESSGGLVPEGEEGGCLKSSADDPTNPTGDLSDTFSDFDVEGIEIQQKTEREIAGEDATCYQVLDTESDEVSTACFNDDGVLLAIESADSSFEATSVGGDVSDSDFEPPYAIVEIPGIPTIEP
jgi:hypothetical protein